MTLDELLASFGSDLKYDDLKPIEKETLYKMYQEANQNKLSVEAIGQHITAMKYAVEEELTKISITADEDKYLKARLKNYILLEAIIMSQERAKRVLEEAIGNLNNYKKE